MEETSEDYNLYGNKLQITVDDEILLPNVVVVENNEVVYIFIATTRSIHQLTFQHPNHQKYVWIIKHLPPFLSYYFVSQGKSQDS